jgi:prophage antirepressor-like protein
MNSVIPFYYESQEVRTFVDEDGNPWWVAKDVCEVLGHSNPSVAIETLDVDERSKKSLGRQGEAWVVSESGLYALIMRSNKPKARPFRKWVTSEVLPSIRSRGIYQLNNGMEAKDLGELVDVLGKAAKVTEILGLKGARAYVARNAIAKDFTGWDALELMGVKDEYQAESRLQEGWSARNVEALRSVLAGISVGGVELGSILIDGEACESRRDELRGIGIRMIDEDTVFVCPKAIEAMTGGKIGEGLSVRDGLMKLSGAKGTRRRINGESVRGVTVPVGSLLG